MLNENLILITGFRLLAILEALSENDLSKSEIADFMAEKYGVMSFSMETMKLDINSLIKAGFKLKRGSKTNDYKLCLEEKYTCFGLSSIEYCVLNIIKHSALNSMDCITILYLRDFFRRLLNTIPNDKFSDLADFKFFNPINIETVKELMSAIKENKKCSIKYESQESIKKEIIVSPVKIYKKNERAYFLCEIDCSNKVISIRLDNIKEVFKTDELCDIPKKTRNNNVRYEISREFYDNYPVRNSEKITKVRADRVLIEAEDDNDFFVCQRLLELGKNCISLKNKKLKNMVIKNLEEVLENYQ